MSSHPGRRIAACRRAGRSAQERKFARGGEVWHPVAERRRRAANAGRVVGDLPAKAAAGAAAGAVIAAVGPPCLEWQRMVCMRQRLDLRVRSLLLGYIHTAKTYILTLACCPSVSVDHHQTAIELYICQSAFRQAGICAAQARPSQSQQNLL